MIIYTCQHECRVEGFPASGCQFMRGGECHSVAAEIGPKDPAPCGGEWTVLRTPHSEEWVCTNGCCLSYLER